MFLTRRHLLFLAPAAVLITTVAFSAVAQVSPSKPKTPEASPSPAGGATNARDTALMKRADALLRKMTLEEKAMQLSSVFPSREE